MKARAHLYVSGLVQGVFFRSKTLTEASYRQVIGWVRNLPDGRVEAVFEGEREKIVEMINFCKKGPTLARVNKVEVLWEDYTGSFKSFSIR